MASEWQIMDFLATLGTSLRRLLRGKQAIVEHYALQERRKICHSCEFLTGSSLKTYRCESCGCLISLKIMFSTAECPEKKWLPLD